MQIKHILLIQPERLKAENPFPALFFIPESLFPERQNLGFSFISRPTPWTCNLTPQVFRCADGP